MVSICSVGETKITGKNQITLPAEGLRELGWGRGDHLIVETLGANRLVLTRQPADWVDEFAGKLDHIFGTPEEARREIEEGRESWGAEPEDAQRSA